MINDKTWIIRNINDLKDTPDYSTLERIVVEGVYHPDIVSNPVFMEMLQRKDEEVQNPLPETENGRRLQNLFVRFWSEDRVYGGVGLRKIPKDAAITLEVRDTMFPLYLLDMLKIPHGRISTVLVSGGAVDSIMEYRVGKNVDISNIDKLIVGEGCVLNCSNLNIDNLTLYNIRSAINLKLADRIHTLVIVSDVEETVDIPLPRGIQMLVVSESQEFNYQVLKTKLPEVIAFIPSKYIPSKFCSGIQAAREPFEKGKLDMDVWNMVRNNYLRV